MSQKKLNESIVDALKNENISEMKTLLKEGADPNNTFKIKDNEYSLLHMAIFYEDIPYVKLLIESGANINQLTFVNGKTNKIGNLTPIQYAVLNGTGESDNFKVLKYLLSKEANIYIRNSTGNHTRDLAKFKEKKENNKKYLKIIDEFFKGKNKLKEKLQEEAQLINKPNKPKKSSKPKKKVNLKFKRKESIKSQKGGNYYNKNKERLLQNLKLISNSM